MSEHISNRDLLVSDLRGELVGPCPEGPEIDCEGELSFDDHRHAGGPFRQRGSGEEILTRGLPVRRYGVGVLYPPGVLIEDEADEDGGESDESADAHEDTGSEAENSLTPEGEKSIEKAMEDARSVGRDAETEDFSIAGANALRPSSIGISFLAEFPPGSSLGIEAAGGRYEPKRVEVSGAARPRTWWLRRPVALTSKHNADELTGDGSRVVTGSVYGEDGLSLEIMTFSRRWHADNRRLLTVCLLNGSEGSGDEHCLFQARLSVRVHSPGGEAGILPYPEPRISDLSAEDASLSLLYSDLKTFAVGHGCAADWSSGGPLRARSVRAEPLPVYEVPSVTPDITKPDGSPLGISMAKLAGLIPGDDGYGDLEELLGLYEKWIERNRAGISTLDEESRPVASRHLDGCVVSLGRMRDGLRFLETDPIAARAFQLANHAILLQQIRSKLERRTPTFEAKAARIRFDTPMPHPNPLEPPPGKGTWRAFQIAFLLAALRSTADPLDAERETVELIWFPTGGGKTEAYLGLAAFAIFMRRLTDPDDAGVQVLMRYTLRLLTTQQFQRAGILMCAMEHLRRLHLEELGESEISIGIWVGQAVTPNTGQRAQEALRKLNRRPDPDSAENPFLLRRCPWCGASLGPFENWRRLAKGVDAYPGYRTSGHSVILRCPDAECEFHIRLPSDVVDEDVYVRRPSFVIGTIDKFARLPWEPSARALFGIDPHGGVLCSPPSLIIQDELHLISGPLGSIAGLYEALIENLCTVDEGKGALPKIICSTATIRRYEDQIRALYARRRVALFPPPGLDVSDSFFARYARREGGELERGKTYVGVYAPGLRSALTANARVFASLLQSPMELEAEPERDPWWTLLLFYLSFRELGANLTLFQSDIPEYLQALRKRAGLEYEQLRRLSSLRMLELTGRKSSSEIPKAIEALEVPCPPSGKAKPLDVCLASSMIEVGIDIERLSLMCVVGQPKTTAQYVQVTGRIGRNWRERPGVVVVLYSFTKARDRSHYEKFRTYHERMYADVEATSVTPFSASVLDRALHAVMVAYVRQRGGSQASEGPWPCPTELLEDLREILIERVRVVDPAEEENLNTVFEQRLSEWRTWERTSYRGSSQDETPPLMVQSGSYVPQHERVRSWPTPMSMRNVDAQCRIAISELYQADKAGDSNG